MKRFLLRFRWHIFFWIVYYIVWTGYSIYAYHSPLWLSLAVTTLWFLGQAPLVYLAIYRWVSRLLKPRRVILFIVSMIIGILISSAFTALTVTWLLRAAVPNYGLSLSTYFGYALSGNVYWGPLAAGVKILRDRLRNDRRHQRLEKERTENELRFLKSQMNPHFLFNAINSIYVLIRKDPDLAEHTLAQFSDMLRYQLYDCATDLIPIEKEITYLESYASLEQMRKGPMLQVDYTMEPTVRHFSVAPLLLMPLVENAFKYVSSFPDRENKVWMRVSFKSPEFLLEIRNTVDEVGVAAAGPDTAAAGPVAGHAGTVAGHADEPGSVGGIGLENVRRRLELLYPGRHSLHIENKNEFYSVTLKLLVL